jgi:hypothetical protein
MVPQHLSAESGVNWCGEGRLVDGTICLSDSNTHDYPFILSSACRISTILDFPSALALSDSDMASPSSRYESRLSLSDWPGVLTPSQVWERRKESLGSSLTLSSHPLVGSLELSHLCTTHLTLRYALMPQYTPALCHDSVELPSMPVRGRVLTIGHMSLLVVTPFAIPHPHPSFHTTFEIVFYMVLL